MHILVTGSTGFVGGALCQALVARGHQVRAFHRSSSPLTLLQGLAVEHAIGDLTQPDTIRQAMQGIEIVFHAAAQLNPNGNIGKTYNVTVEGTRSVLAAAQAAGVRRVVHTSSVAALGVPEKGPWQARKASTGIAPTFSGLMDENHTWNYPHTRWIYGYAKYLAELEVQNAVSAGLDAVIVNPSLVFGPGDIYRMTNSLIVAAAHKRIPPVSIPGGLNVVAIEDVVAGHLVRVDIGDFDVVAEDLVVAHLQVGDARAGDLADLVFGQPACPVGGDTAEAVELLVEAVGDDAALAEDRRTVGGDGSLDQRRRRFQARQGLGQRLERFGRHLA